MSALEDDLSKAFAPQINWQQIAGNCMGALGGIYAKVDNKQYAACLQSLFTGLNDKEQAFVKALMDMMRSGSPNPDGVIAALNKLQKRD